MQTRLHRSIGPPVTVERWTASRPETRRPRVQDAYLDQPVVRVGPTHLDNVIEKYFDMSVVEMPLDKAFDAISTEIDGMETVGALMLARQFIDR